MQNLFDAGYVCGVICSDGSIEWNKGNYRISLESKDKGFVENFLHKLSALVNKNINIHTRTRIYKNKNYTTYLVNCYGKKIVSEFLQRWELKKADSFSWGVPIIAFGSQEFRRGFLQGFFDGEATIRIRFKKMKRCGSVTKIRNIRVQLVNRVGLEEIRHLLELEGIKCMLYPAGHKYFMLDIEGKFRLNLFKEKIGFSIKEKQEKLEYALSYEKRAI